MFLKVVDTVITQEIEPKQVKNAKATDRELLPEAEQSEYDVLYGDSLQRPSGKRK